MEQLKFRNLTIDEIEVRVGGGGNLLLYKTARTDAKLHLYDTETQRKNYDIPFEIIDTIYNL